jgi:hypothetical protein
MGVELTLLFGTTLNLIGLEDTAQEAEFGANSQRLWAWEQASGLELKVSFAKVRRLRWR